jgi:hypothetical protein
MTNAAHLDIDAAHVNQITIAASMEVNNNR